MLRLPRAKDKTMQGVEHDINKICKMSRPMSKGVLGGLPLGPSQAINLKPKLTPFMTFCRYSRTPQSLI